MSNYQKNEISRLKTIGWSESGSSFLGSWAGAGRVFKMTNESGHRAYIYLNWVQYIV